MSSMAPAPNLTYRGLAWCLTKAVGRAAVEAVTPQGKPSLASLLAAQAHKLLVRAHGKSFYPAQEFLLAFHLIDKMRNLGIDTKPGMRIEALETTLSADGLSAQVAAASIRVNGSGYKIVLDRVFTSNLQGIPAGPLARRLGYQTDLGRVLREAGLFALTPVTIPWYLLQSSRSSR